MENFFKKSFYSYRELFDIYIKKIKKIPWILGKHAFLCVLMLILIDIFIGGFLFYKYIYIIETEEISNLSISSKFQEDIYKSILEEWQNRENILVNLPLMDKNYTDPFK